MKKNIFFALKLFWKNQQSLLFKKYNRTLPFGEYVVDRWEKANLLGFGEGSSIYDSAVVFGKPKIGKNVWIGPFVILDAAKANLTIGSNCSISAGVQIYTHDSVKWAVSGGRASYEYEDVYIGNNCYIGPNVIIAKGVEIGEGCIIGAGSIVLKSIPAGSKAYGNPCKIVEIIDEKVN